MHTTNRVCYKKWYPSQQKIDKQQKHSHLEDIFWFIKLYETEQLYIILSLDFEAEKPCLTIHWFDNLLGNSIAQIHLNSSLMYSSSYWQAWHCSTQVHNSNIHHLMLTSLTLYVWSFGWCRELTYWYLGLLLIFMVDLQDRAFFSYVITFEHFVLMRLQMGWEPTMHHKGYVRPNFREHSMWVCYICFLYWFITTELVLDIEISISLSVSRWD